MMNQSLNLAVVLQYELFIERHTSGLTEACKSQITV